MHVHVRTSAQGDQGRRRPWGTVPYSCEPPCGCGELNLGLLTQQPVSLTTEPSLQPFLIQLKLSFLDFYTLLGKLLILKINCFCFILDLCRLRFIVG